MQVTFPSRPLFRREATRLNFDRFFVWLPNSGEIISEDVILKWYKEAHSVKGKSVFLEQMSKFIEWLNNAEEGQ